MQSITAQSGAAPIIGTAGWTIPSKDAGRFPEEGMTLQRYAGRFAGVEINSSFHRSHRVATWQRWAGSVPADFQFAVKIPKTISHQRKLADCADLAVAFLEEADALGEKLSVLLLQLPPKLAFDAPLVEDFLGMLQTITRVRVACEPRHPSWFNDEVDAFLDKFQVARVAADPACVSRATLPGGWRGFSYFRLHGSPQMYRSSYDDARLDAYAALVRGELEADRSVWCMFDNTASSAATGNALALLDRL